MMCVIYLSGVWAALANCALAVCGSVHGLCASITSAINRVDNLSLQVFNDQSSLLQIHVLLSSLALLEDDAHKAVQLLTEALVSE